MAMTGVVLVGECLIDVCHGPLHGSLLDSGARNLQVVLHQYEGDLILLNDLRETSLDQIRPEMVSQIALEGLLASNEGKASSQLLSHQM